MSTPIFAQDNDVLWQTGNKEFTAGNYTQALNSYNRILASGNISSELFYNLGNCYYKEDQIAKAILYYNKALRLDPLNKDIQHNLTLASSQTSNKIDPLPKFFLAEWVNGFAGIFSSNGWAKASLYMISITLIAIAIFIFSNTYLKRKLFFIIGCVFLVLFIISIGFSIKQKNIILHSSEAIVMESSSAVKSSPDFSGKDLFILDGGIKVLVIEQVGEWSEIEIENGNRGWIENKNIETIDL
ncbi:MAG: tetratricopeptide repeat protein [Rikenellaceae bacterium]